MSHRIASWILIPLFGGLVTLMQGCATVHQKDREYLSDPILQRQDDALESRIESHDFPRREGSVGGSAGAGGGCGC
jgi:Domain of unknown function (DUF4266)